jgi:hypothetical protein
MSRLTRNGSFALLTSVCVLALTCMSLALTGGSALASYEDNDDTYWAAWL